MVAVPIADAWRKVRNSFKVEAIIKYVDLLPNDIETTIVSPPRKLLHIECFKRDSWFTKCTGGFDERGNGLHTYEVPCCDARMFREEKVLLLTKGTGSARRVVLVIVHDEAKLEERSQVM